MTKETNSEAKGINTYLPKFRGFYGSIYEEIDFFGEAEHYGLPDKFPLDDFTNWNEYYHAIAVQIKNFVEQNLKEHGFIKEITFQQMVSPKEYNFTNDSVNCEIVPVNEAIKAFIYDNIEAFKKYLIDHLRSRDGFISFHSHYFEDWKDMTKDFTDFDVDTNVGKGFHLGFLLGFICDTHEELIEELSTENEYYFVNERVNFSEFYNEDFDKIIALKENTGFYDFENGEVSEECINYANARYGEIKEYTQRNYSLDTNVKQSAINEFCNEQYYLEREDSNEYTVFLYGNFERYIDFCISEIDNQKNQLEIELKK